MVRLFTFFRSFERQHYNQIIVSSSEGAIQYALTVFYVILPVLVMSLYNETVAGIFLGAFNLIQAFFFNPISGALTDKFGARKMLIASSLILGVDGILFFILPISLVSIVVFTSIYFVAYSLRVADTYILRITEKRSGGLMFGLYEDLRAIAFFLAALSIPFFTVSKNYKLAGLVLLAVSILNFFMVLKVKPDLKISKRISLKQTFNLLFTIRNGFRFIKENKGFPYLVISSAVFEGFFHGTIWFLFPVHFINNQTTGFLGSMQLGIYEIITILFAGYAGYLADKHKWHKILKIGWALTILGVALMPFFPFSIGLILTGVIIAIGNNLFSFSAEHALEEYDIDHKEDGEFMALKNVVLDTCFGIAPIIAGVLYGLAGFQVTLIVLAVFIGGVGVFTLVLASRLMHHKKNTSSIIKE